MSKTKTYLLASIVSALVLAIGVSVAYFTVQIEGTGKTMSVNTANLRVIFSDTNAAITNTAIKPGWTASKTFSVESKTDASYDYDIVIKNLVNTFVTEGYLQYQIVGSGGGISQDWTDVPKSATATDTVLVHSVPLAVNAKHTYTVNFRYLNDANADQSSDMGKSFTGSIMITEGTTAPVTSCTLYDDGSGLTKTQPTNDKIFATYTCENGTATMEACSYVSSSNEVTVCDGADLHGTSPLWFCTTSDDDDQLYNSCHDNLGGLYDTLGLQQSASCSCN